MKPFSRTAIVLTGVQHNTESPLTHFLSQVALNLFSLVLKTRTNIDVSILLLDKMQPILKLFIIAEKLDRNNMEDVQ